jgi:hypothetical protein
MDGSGAVESDFVLLSADADSKALRLRDTFFSLNLPHSGLDRSAIVLLEGIRVTGGHFIPLVKTRQYSLEAGVRQTW